MKRNRMLAALIGTVIVITGCSAQADVASENLSTAADNFEIDRRVVFFNGITDSYLLTIEGRCSIKDENAQLEVTCKVGPDTFKKHFLGLSDNVSYFVEQSAPVAASAYQYRVIFRPSTIIPDPEADLGGN